MPFLEASIDGPLSLIFTCVLSSYFTFLFSFLQHVSCSPCFHLFYLCLCGKLPFSSFHCPEIRMKVWVNFPLINQLIESRTVYWAPAVPLSIHAGPRQDVYWAPVVCLKWCQELTDGEAERPKQDPWFLGSNDLKDKTDRNQKPLSFATHRSHPNQLPHIQVVQGSPLALLLCPLPIC